MTHVCQCNEVDLKGLEPIVKKYHKVEGALIPVLQAAQAIYGYLPGEALEKIAEGLKLPISQIFGVVTFYSQFRLKPQGKNVIRVCQGTACHVRGAKAIIETIEEDLNIYCGDTTKDGQFTLESVACVGACSLGPVLLVNEHTHGRLKPDQLHDILAGYKSPSEEEEVATH